MKNLWLRFEIAILITLLSALAIGLSTFLNNGKFDRIFSELEVSRIQFILNNISATLETGLDLGIPIDGLINSQNVIEFEAKKDSSILSISIHNEAGRIVFSTGKTTVDKQIPDSWLAAQSTKRSSSFWEINDKNELTLGKDLLSSYGASVGGVVLQYSRQSHESAMQSIGSVLMKISIAAALLTAVIMMFGIHLFFNRFNKQLNEINVMLDCATIDSTKHSEPIESFNTSLPKATTKKINDMINSVNNVASELAPPDSASNEGKL